MSVGGTRVRRRGSGRLAAVALLATLTGCSVGPDYQRPTVVEPAEYKEIGDWRPAAPADHQLGGTWWQMYDDPILADLLEQVALANQNLAVAEANFRQARAMVMQARAGWYPQLTVGLSASRAAQSGSLFNNLGGSGSTVNDFAMPFNLAWEIDVWGRVRRGVEGAVAGAQSSAADVAAARLSLQSETAINYFQLRSLDAQAQLFEQTIDAYERSLALTRNRYAGGIASRADVVQAEAQLERTRTDAIDLRVQRAQLEHAIAVLVGAAASDFSLAPAPMPAAPPVIPVGIPSQLLERRPDVASAERLAAAANAQIGVATAAYFPTVTLSASSGFESSDFSEWFTWPSRFWSVGPTVTQTIFDGGLRASATDEARAGFDASVATYRQTVLTAFQEVEDNLAALRLLAHAADAQEKAVVAAQDSVTLTTNQYKEGVVSYLNVVTVQALALNDQRTAIDLLARRLAASAQLVTALGGGWDAVDLPPPDEFATWPRP
jgi:NodT family efflux transporter outer membrane factor (OMF) lipoprotein